MSEQKVLYALNVAMAEDEFFKTPIAHSFSTHRLTAIVVGDGSWSVAKTQRGEHMMHTEESKYPYYSISPVPFVV